MRNTGYTDDHYCGQTMNFPNALTIGRIIATPVIIGLLFTDSLAGLLTSMALFVVAAISDFLDGFMARSMHLRSRLGQFLDPLADKVLVLGTFIGFSILMPRVIPWWAVTLIFARDALITGLRIWHESHQRSLKTFFIAKAKTSVQLIFLVYIFVLLVGASTSGGFQDVARATLYGSTTWFLMLGVVLFTVWTGIIYLVDRNAVMSD